MRVGELKEGVLLVTSGNFKIWTSGGGMLRFIRWSEAKVKDGPMVYLGRKHNQPSTHEVLYQGDICHIGSADFKYLSIL